MRRPKIVGVSASSRSRCAEGKMRDALAGCSNRDDLGYTIEQMAFSKQMSNSEACLMASLFGVSTEGCSYEIVQLKKYFPRLYPNTITPEKERELLDIVRDADGFVISTPVYFGISSSYVHDFIEFLRRNSLIESKVFGLASVGAKRNGGQETAIILALMELSKSGAIVCGNGPSTSQYGGTACAGDLGAIRSDISGLDTSTGVGRKVAQAAKFLCVADPVPTQELAVQVWITKEQGSLLADRVKRVTGQVAGDLPFPVDFELIDLTQLELSRCVACSVCPFHFGKDAEYGIYKDKIQGDDLAPLYAKLISPEALIVAGYNPLSSAGLRDIYQIFVERTRQIRRDHFLLSNVPVAAYALEEVGATSSFSMNVLLSFLRHNTILLPPIEELFAGSIEGVTPASLNRIRTFLELSSRIRHGARHFNPERAEYKPVGYDLSAGRDSLKASEQEPET